MRIQNKIFLMIISITIPVYILLFFLIPAGIEDNMIDDILMKVRNYQQLSHIVIRQNLTTYSEDNLRKQAKEIADELAEMFSVSVSVYNEIRMLADSGNYYDEVTPEVEYALKGESTYRKKGDFLYYAFPIKDLGAVRLQYPLSNVHNVTSETVMWLGIIVLIMIVLSLTGAGLISRKISAPIIKLNKETKKIKDGNYNLSIQTESNDEVGQLTGSFIEMSGQVRNKINQLQEMLEKEKKLKNAQKEFLNSVTHEFKTPLTSIIGYSDLLQQYKDDPDLLNEGASIIRKESERLYTLVEKVLYLSRMERYDIILDKEEFNVGDLIEEAVSGLKLKAEERDITVNKQIKYTGSFRGDFSLLYRMMVNLLDNAIKYNRKGGEVLVKIEKVDDVDGKEQLQISVKDNGTGIARKDLSRIFDPFYREDKNRSRKIGGDGLGLSIVKEIVKKHEGKIHIESEKGQGTEVIIFFPLR